MIETIITRAIQQEVLNLLDLHTEGVTRFDVGTYLHENVPHLCPDPYAPFDLSDWQSESAFYLGDLGNNGLAVGTSFPMPLPTVWTRTAKDATQYLAAVEAAENEQPEPADDREAIDAAWAAMRAEM